MAKEIKIEKRLHRATYAADKRKGGWLIRVTGPSAALFTGRKIPVSLKDGTEHDETLNRIIWTGIDKESGDTVALYTFAALPFEAKPVDF